MRPRFFAYCLIALGLTATIPGCGADHNNNLNKVGPSDPVTVKDLQVEGPETIPPGQSAQYTAMVTYSDGRRVPSSNASWSSNSSVVSINGAGVARAFSQLGDGTISVSVQIGSARRNASREVVVVPEGTYRVIGQVTEEGQGSTPVTDAHLEIGGTAMRVPTDWSGRYGLYGVSPDATLTVTRDGYQPQTRTLHLTRHAVENFRLTLTSPRLGLSGGYTVTVEANGGCPGYPPLRGDLRRREFAATLTQTSADILVRLTDGVFAVRDGRGDRFAGRADAGGATFRLRAADTYYYYYYVYSYADVTERLPDGTYLAVVGDAQPRGNDTAMSGDLTGQIRQLSSGFPDTATVLGCAQTTRMGLNKH